MSWVKIDDRLPEHPKFYATSCRERALNRYIIALCYCSRNLTDGVVPKAILHEGRGNEAVCKSMVEAGLFTENRTSYMVKDYLEWNRSKAQVLDIQEKRRSAGKQKSSKLLTVCSNIVEAKRTPDTDTDTDKVKTLVQKRAKTARLDGFDEWWSEQGRKEGKGAASKAYATALTKTDAPTLLAGWRRSKAAYTREGRDRTKYPLPATWLNQERWADEYDEPAPTRALREPCTNPNCIGGMILNGEEATPCPMCH